MEILVMDATSSLSWFSSSACFVTRCRFSVSFYIVRNNWQAFNRFHRALADQPKTPIFSEPYATWVPIALFITGQTFVITSTWALGITGTFLGDYFGILMDHRVEGFPFNVLRDPMYVGSTMCFAGTALWYVYLLSWSNLSLSILIL